MNRKIAWSFCLLALALCLGTSPASAGTIFTDLGPPGNVYNCCTGWTVSGTGTLGTSFTAANLFTAAIGGSVTQIDLGVGAVVAPPTFDASIWTDASNLPGTQVPGAFWGGLTATQPFGGCCGLVTIPVSGVSLTAGQSYFMILGPVSTSDTSWNAWNWNNQGVNGLDLYSTDGGVTWNSNGTGFALGAFDIKATTVVPEPGAAILTGTALMAIVLGLGWRRSS